MDFFQGVAPPHWNLNNEGYVIPACQSETGQAPVLGDPSPRSQFFYEFTQRIRPANTPSEHSPHIAISSGRPTDDHLRVSLLRDRYCFCDASLM